MVEMEDNYQQWALVPFGVAHPDHRDLRYLGVADREVLQLDRGYPLAARLDDILGPVGDLHVAGRIDGGDVAGVEKAVGVQDAAGLLEIGLGDRGAAHLEPAGALAVAGDLV